MCIKMNKKEILRFILLFMAIVTLLIFIKKINNESDYVDKAMETLSFSCEINKTEMSFSPWISKEENTLFLVLPPFIKENNLPFSVLYKQRQCYLVIDDESISSGDVWTDKYDEKKHNLKFLNKKGTPFFEIDFQILYSANLPSMCINTKAKEQLLRQLDYSKKEYIENGQMNLFSEHGELLVTSELERFKVRGNLTAELAKKPFSMILAKEKRLLGMDSAKGWNLLANATDGSNIRNKMVMDWANLWFDTYQPDGEFVDLYLNGEYQGLYLLTEKVERGVNRLNISEDNGIFLEMNLENRITKKDFAIKTSQGHYFSVITDSYYTDVELEDIKDYLNDIESALYSDSEMSDISNRPLEELIDFDSWTKTWLIEEISSDHDLGTASQYEYVENWANKSKLKAGPVWDFDGTFGNAMVPLFQNPYGLVTAKYDVKGIESNTQNRWLSPMYNNSKFRKMIIEKYISDARGQIDRWINVEIDQYSNEIQRSSLLNALRWLGDGHYDYFCFPDDFSLNDEAGYKKYDVLDQHTTMIKNFLKEKRKFLDELWIENAEFDIYEEDINHYDGFSKDLQNNIYTWIKRDVSNE